MYCTRHFNFYFHFYFHFYFYSVRFIKTYDGGLNKKRKEEKHREEQRREEKQNIQTPIQMLIKKNQILISKSTDKYEKVILHGTNKEIDVESSVQRGNTASQPRRGRASSASPFDQIAGKRGGGGGGGGNCSVKVRDPLKPPSVTHLANK